LEANSFLYLLNTCSEEMFVIQSGLVEIYHSFDKGKGEFVIEKLYRGSIVNHNSFLMNDGIDTNAICRNIVSVYYIHIDIVNAMRQKYIDLDYALQAQERILINPRAKEPALDYIIADPYSRSQWWHSNKHEITLHNFESEERRRKLTVKLKNSIMAVWLEVKA
jgi:hypothetical protein